LCRRRSSRLARSSSRAMERSSAATGPCGIRGRSVVNRSSASRHAMRASAAPS
jgi:hypothetical protein